MSLSPFGTFRRLRWANSISRVWAVGAISSTDTVYLTDILFVWQVYGHVVKVYSYNLCHIIVMLMFYCNVGVNIPTKWNISGKLYVYDHIVIISARSISLC